MHFLSVIWDPSIGIDLGFFTIRWYSLMAAAFLLGLYLMKKIFINDNIDVKQLVNFYVHLFSHAHRNASGRSILQLGHYKITG